jgi:hypothetical protein
MINSLHRFSEPGYAGRMFTSSPLRQAIVNGVIGLLGIDYRPFESDGHISPITALVSHAPLCRLTRPSMNCVLTANRRRSATWTSMALVLNACAPSRSRQPVPDHLSPERPRYSARRTPESDHQRGSQHVIFGFAALLAQNGQVIAGDFSVVPDRASAVGPVLPFAPEFALSEWRRYSSRTFRIVSQNGYSFLY